MSWQDMVISLGQTGFVVLLTRTVLDKGTQIARSTSLWNAFIIAVFAYVFGTLGLWGSCVTEAILAVLWGVLAWKRPTKRRVEREMTDEEARRESYL